MKRLADNSEAINAVFKDVATDGRELMKRLEDFKFRINQCVTLSQNNQEIADKLRQNNDMVDKLQSALYSICFNLENVDIVPLYDNTQIDMSEQDVPDSQEDNYDLNEEIPIEDEVVDIQDEETEGTDEENADDELSESDETTDEDIDLDAEMEQEEEPAEE